MHLAYEWSEFLPIVTTLTTANQRKTQTVPVFLVQTGVVGALKITNLKHELLSEPACRVEIKLEGQYAQHEHDDHEGSFFFNRIHEMRG